MASKKPPKGKKTAQERAPICSVCENRHMTKDPHIFKKAKA